ncbi:MAG: hypothetical protein ABR574_05810, partial [Cryomorphaceae bacterium]
MKAQLTIISLFFAFSIFAQEPDKGELKSQVKDVESDIKSFEKDIAKIEKDISKIRPEAEQASRDAESISALHNKKKAEYEAFNVKEKESELKSKSKEL